MYIENTLFYVPQVEGRCFALVKENGRALAFRVDDINYHCNPNWNYKISDMEYFVVDNDEYLNILIRHVKLNARRILDGTAYEHYYGDDKEILLKFLRRFLQ